MRKFLEALLFVMVLLPTVVLSIGIKDLRVSAETRVLAGPDNPVRLSLERFERRFAQNNNLLFVLTLSDRSVFTAEGLRAIDAATERAWQLPYASRVDSITNFPLIIAEDESFGVSSLHDRGLPRTRQELEDARAEVLAEPWLAGLLIDPGTHVAGINVLFILPPEATSEIAEIMVGVESLRADMARDFPDAELYVTGNVALMNAFAQSARRDIAFLIPLALLLVVAIAYAFLRDIRLVGALAVYLMLCSLGAMGAAGWVGYILNPATVTAPIIIMTLGLASIIHFMSGIQTALNGPRSVAQAVNFALAENRYPITVTIATTAFGFICMNAAASPPLRELGNIVVVGLMIALGLALFVMPIVLRGLQIKPRHMPSRRILEVFIARVGRKRFLILFASVAVCLLSLTGITKIRFDDDFIRYFNDTFSYRVASDFAEDNLTGLNILEFAIESGEAHGINEPDYIERLDTFSTWLRAQPNVEHVTSLSDKLSQIHHTFRPTAPGGALPESRDIIAQYLLLFELSLPPGNDIADRINADRSATRVTAILRHVTSADLRELNARAEEWLVQNNPIATQTRGHSINYFFAALSLTNIKAMIGGTILALVLISFIVLVALQDFRLGAISLVSNVLPLVIGFGIWGYGVGQIGLASSVVAAMTFGIVVDDTIHLLLRFKRERSKGASAETAIRLAFVDVGRAIVITSLALTGGFLLLLFSGFEINSSLGLFISIIVIAALVTVLTLVPVLVLLTYPNVPKSVPAEHKNESQDTERSG